MQDRVKRSSSYDAVSSSFANCFSRLQLPVSNAFQHIVQSRPVQFIARLNSQHSYVFLSVKVVVWLLLWAWFIGSGFGAIFFILSLICFVWMNTGTKPRAPGVPSAYSVFNENCERIEGTFTAEQFDEGLRHGSFLVSWLCDTFRSCLLALTALCDWSSSSSSSYPFINGWQTQPYNTIK